LHADHADEDQYNRVYALQYFHCVFVFAAVTGS
jgi:hypothetical protein